MVVPNDIAYGEIVCSFVVTVAKKIGFSDEEANMIELGMDEAFTNAVEHAFESDEEESIEISCKQEAESLIVSIREKGLPFDPTLVQQYNPKAALNERSERGMGMYLMCKCFDDVTYTNLGRGGKEILLTKQLDKKTIDDFVNTNDLTIEPEAISDEGSPKKRIEFTLRMMKPEEAIEVCKCIYMSYGYTYSNESAYFPERLVSMNEEGLVDSLVAISPENEVAGHSAILFEDPKDQMGEFGMAVVKPKFRGQGCLNKLASNRMEHAINKGVKALFGKGVTTHPYSQRSMHKLGFRDGLIMLASVPMTRKYKNISEKISQRESHIICFTFLEPRDERTIYPPTHHQEMIKQIYDNLNVKIKFGTPNLAKQDDQVENKNDAHQFKTETSTVKETEFSISLDRGKSLAHIKIEHPDHTNMHELKTIHRDFLFNKLDVIYVYLNLEDPGTISMVDELEKMGYFFSGIKPRVKMSDWLVLQYLNNIKLDYSLVKAYSDFAEKMKEYISRHDPNLKSI